MLHCLQHLSHSGSERKKDKKRRWNTDMKGKESCGKEEEKREGRDQKESVENKKSGQVSEDGSVERDQ